MDARLTEEQRSLRDVVARMVRKYPLSTVGSLGDSTRIEGLARDIADAGLLELRAPARVPLP